jgi:probable HAF family extracellular repeat protein
MRKTMKSRSSICYAAVTVFAALSIPLGLAAQEQQSKKLPHYALTVLDTLGGSNSVAQGINNKGQLAGVSQLSGDTAAHAVLWTKGLITDLGSLQGGPLSGTFTNPNERGEVSGMSNTSTPDPNGEDFCFFGSNLICLGFLWKNGVLTAMPTLGGNNSLAYQLNDREQVVGVAETPATDPTCPASYLEAKPVIWQDGTLQELPTISGDTDGFGYGINDRGQIVGATGTCNQLVPFSSVHAVLWPNGPNGGVIDLGNLGSTTLNIAFYINNQGQVVGQSGVPGGANFHAFLWTRASGMQDLGTLPGDVVSWANNINNKGQVVGTSFPVTGSRAFLWQDGVMTDLNTLIPPDSPLYLLEAFGINDRGQIAGFGQLSDGELRGYLLNPCGEGDERCGGSNNAVLQTSPASRDLPSATSPPPLMRRMNRYRFPGPAFGPGN